MTGGLAAECLQRTRQDLVEGAVGIDRLQLVAVVVQQRRGLIAVHPEPIADDVLGVVGAAAARQARHQFLLGNPELDHGVQFQAAALEHVVQGLGLFDRAGETVENEPARHVVVVEPVVDQGVGERGRHEIAGVEILLGFQSELGAAGDVLPEQFTGGDLRHAELLGKLDRLRALAGPRRAQQDNPHLRKPS